MTAPNRRDHTVTINAPRAIVWETIADIAGIDEWAAGVRHAELNDERATGVGAGRTCKLAPMGTLVETVETWHEGTSFTITVDKGLPFQRAAGTWTLEGPDDGPTTATWSTEIERGSSLRARLLGSTMEARMSEGFDTLVLELRDHVQTRLASDDADAITS